MHPTPAPTEAFGRPGIAPTWCSSDKDFVTTALGSSRLWATVIDARVGAALPTGADAARGPEKRAALGHPIDFR
jgi:hypothetical protein